MHLKCKPTILASFYHIDLHWTLESACINVLKLSLCHLSVAVICISVLCIFHNTPGKWKLWLSFSPEQRWLDAYLAQHNHIPSISWILMSQRIWLTYDLLAPRILSINVLASCEEFLWWWFVMLISVLNHIASSAPCHLPVFYLKSLKIKENSLNLMSRWNLTVP